MSTDVATSHTNVGACFVEQKPPCRNIHYDPTITPLDFREAQPLRRVHSPSSFSLRTLHLFPFLPHTQSTMGAGGQVKKAEREAAVAGKERKEVLIDGMLYDVTSFRHPGEDRRATTKRKQS